MAQWLTEVRMVAKISIGQRIPRSDIYPLGWKFVASVPSDEACAIYLGGDGATEDKLANGYAKIIETETADALPEKINIYSVKYDFTGHSKEIARKLNFLQHRATALATKNECHFIMVHASEYTLDPPYINTLYQATLAPRITTSDGKHRLPAQEAARNVRKITFVSHCHGGYVAHMLEKKMRSHLTQLGYSQEEKNLITSQMLVIAHAPSCPLGIQKSSFYSFRSAYDAEGETGWNLLPEYIRHRKKEERFRFNGEKLHNQELIEQNRWFELPATYMEKKRLFLIKQKRPWVNEDDGPFMANPQEHGEIQYGFNGETKDGMLMLLMAHNVLVSGLLNSLRQKSGFTPLPPIESLILDNSPNTSADVKQDINSKLTSAFNEMKISGKKLNREIITYYQRIRQNRQA